MKESSIISEPPIVFVVDDDASVREALDSLLRSVKLRVQTFATAREFLKAARHHGPACVVLDIRLPDENGLQVQRELSAAGCSLPLIFITGHGDIPMSVQAMKGGTRDAAATDTPGTVAVLDQVKDLLDRMKAT